MRPGKEQSRSQHPTDSFHTYHPLEKILSHDGASDFFITLIVTRSSR
jgi:hypothetical protein